VVMKRTVVDVVVVVDVVDVVWTNRIRVDS
jgi:hypothetical protein